MASPSTQMLRSFDVGMGGERGPHEMGTTLVSNEVCRLKLQNISVAK